MDKEKTISWAGLAHLIVIYIVWGSTYLAIRVAVREGSGFPPFILGGTRVVSAGLVLLIWSILRKKRIRLSSLELKILALSGILLWVGGNGLVNWSEQRVDSSLAALIIAATPIWTAIVVVLLDKELPTLRMVSALLVGFGGMVVLSIPVLREGVQADVMSIIGLLIAGLSWGTGSVIQSRKSVALDPVVSAGYQQLFGGSGLLILAMLVKEPMPKPILEAWFAWLYLLLFGSILAFTSFVKALRLLPTKVVMTYPYINPVIAIYLGWLILDENVSLWTAAGAVLILLGVGGVFRERYRKVK
jgi:drug/metabolite transporter (DMT)-like permease